MSEITPAIDFRNELAGLFDLSGQTAFVPGGYGGIGEAVCWGLAMRGAHVAVAGRSEHKAVTLAEAITGSGFRAHGTALDVESVDDIRNTVNGVAPTFVYTEMIRHVMENPEFRDSLLARIPLGRIADPKDVTGAVVFFTSPGAGFVTGQTLYVDGGITASQ